MIFKEHVQAFRKGFRKTVRLMKRSKPKTYDVEQLRHTYPRAYAEWTKEEDGKLRGLYARNKTIKELVGIFQRKPSAIRSRPRKLSKLSSV